MARPLRIEFQGTYYHIIQRGIERKPIFPTEADKNKFLYYIDLAFRRYGALIHAFTLMDNHYHLILETPRANLSRTMHFLNTSYAVYFNAKRKRRGPLYQGRFKAILVQQDEYLHHLSRYIHLNPVRAKIVKDPKDYSWSSYKCLTSTSIPPQWLDISFTLSLFDKNQAKAKTIYKQFVLDLRNDEKKIINENTISGLILGNGDFAEKIIDTFIVGLKDSEIPIINDLKRLKEPSLEQIRDLVEGTIKENRRLRRKALLYLSRKHTQKTLNDIAAFCGKIRDTGVSQAFVTTEKARGEDRELDNLLARIEKSLKV